jgi:hypothetical protein
LSATYLCELYLSELYLSEQPAAAASHRPNVGGGLIMQAARALGTSDPEAVFPQRC